jgi:hypothetical protein
VAAAFERQYAAEGRAFLESLAEKLLRVLPGESEVKRGGLFGSGPVRFVRIQLGDDRYALEDPGRGPLRATRTRVVRGIALKTEELQVEQWVTEFGERLEQRAGSSAAARAALSRLVG